MNEFLQKAHTLINVVNVKPKFTLCLSVETQLERDLLIDFIQAQSSAKCIECSKEWQRFDNDSRISIYVKPTGCHFRGMSFNAVLLSYKPDNELADCIRPSMSRPNTVFYYPE